MRPVREGVEKFKPKPGRESGEAVRIKAPTIYGVTMLVTSRWSDAACKAAGSKYATNFESEIPEERNVFECLTGYYDVERIARYFVPNIWV